MTRRTRAGAGTLYLVHVLTHATRNRLDASLAALGLSSFQYTVLSVIDHNEGLSSASLSKRFHVTPQAMGETVIMLEQRGWLARTEDARNRKMLRLSLTEDGHRIVAQADAIVGGFEAIVFADQSPEDLEVFRETLLVALNAVRQAPTDKKG